MKNDSILKTIRDVLVALITVMLGCFAIWYFFDTYYDMNDDVLIKDILSGTYTGTPDGHNIQMLFPIGALISLLYKAFPTIGGVSMSWYGYFLCGAHALCCFLILKRAMSFASHFATKLLILGASIITAWALLLYNFIFIQYTVTSALLASTAIFLYFTTKDELSVRRFNRQNVVVILLLAISFMVRTEMMLLLCPMMLVAGLCKWFHGSAHTGHKPLSAESITKYLVVPVIVLVLMGIGLAVNGASYGSEEWTEFNRFFDARTELYDFQSGAPRYSENDELYDAIELKNGEVALFGNYNFALDDHIDANAMERIVEYNTEALGENYFKQSLLKTIGEYFYRMTHKEDAPYSYVVWLLYILLILFGALMLDTTVVWKVLGMVLGRSVSWFYIIARGRMPERITVPLYLCEILILLAMLLVSGRRLWEEYSKEQEKSKFYLRVAPFTAGALLVILLLIPMYQTYVRTQGESARREAVNEEWKYLTAYFMEHPENYYVLDVYSTVQYSEKMFVDVDNSYRNYDICGGWSAKSPIYKEKLAQMGISNLQSDLVNMNNVYFVTRVDRDMAWMVTYYKDKGYEVRVEPKGSFRMYGDIRFVIYKLRLVRAL